MNETRERGMTMKTALSDVPDRQLDENIKLMESMMLLAKGKDLAALGHTLRLHREERVLRDSAKRR
jgi:hypothetical protein